MYRERYSIPYINKGLRRMGLPYLMTKEGQYLKFVDANNKDVKGLEPKDVGISPSGNTLTPDELEKALGVLIEKIGTFEKQRIGEDPRIQLFSEVTKPPSNLEKRVTKLIIVLSGVLIILSGFKINGNVIADSVKTTNSIISILAIILVFLGIAFYKIKNKRIV